MTEFFQTVVTGLMAGSLYSVVGLSLVLVYVSTRMINFAQGEIGTLSAFVAWSLMLSVPYALGFPLAMGLAFVIGAFMLRFVMWPLLAGAGFMGQGPMGVVVASIGLLLVMTAVSNSIYGPEPHAFEEPFKGGPLSIGDVTVGRHNVYLFVLSGGAMVFIWALFRFTKVGLAMRATADNRIAAELMGVPTPRMLTLGWGLAGAMSGIAAMLVAPIVTLTPGMMLGTLMFGFASAVLGGFNSPQGAVVGGLAVGVMQNLTGVYLADWVSYLHLPFDIADPGQYRDIVAMSVIVLVMVIRPTGLFGKPEVARV